MEQVNQSQPGAGMGGGNQINSGAVNPPRHGSTLAIWLLILGIVVGAVGMWAFDSFFRIPNLVAERTADELSAMKEDISQEKSDSEYIISGQLMEIDFESSTISVVTGNEELEGGIIQNEEAIFRIDENTVYKVISSENADLLDSSFDSLISGQTVTVKSDEPIINNLRTYYAKEIIQF